jgi:hypothetical protein
LGNTLGLQGLHDFRYQPRQFPLGFEGVLSPDYLIANEGEVVTDEHARTKGNPDREGTVI